MKIALHLYALRNHIKKEEDLVNTLHAIKAMGYDAIHLSGIPDWKEERLVLLQQTCESLQLEIAGTHVRAFQTDMTLEPLIKNHHMLNTSYLGIGSMPENYDRKNLTHYQDFILQCNKIAKELEPHHLILTYHHHAFEFSKMNGLYPIDIIMQNMMMSKMKLEVDLYWLQYAGINPLEFILKYQHQIAMIHLKDMRIAISDHWSTEQQFCAIGDGNIAYRRIIPQLRTLPIEWLIIGQDEFYGADPWEELHKSLYFVKGLV